ncbi:hypothetical protein Ciccas_012617 [Cichlidogyrus casuarinus]|uniref:Uncharacterized protein n=1 Tax=Cichlidogyrus casuarinus TaxID=1844966 RepID=A0ABD2PQW9_9PLAT
MGQRDLIEWASMTTHGRAAIHLFPHYAWSDTVAGRVEEEQRLASASAAFYSRPKKQRPRNFVECHFKRPWQSLVDGADPFILRDEHLLKLLVTRMLDACCKPLSPARLTRKHLADYHSSLNSALVLTLVKCCKRGSPKPYSAIHLMDYSSHPALGYTILGGFHPGVASGFGLALISLAGLAKCFELYPNTALSFVMLCPESSKLYPIKLSLADSFTQSY